MKKHVNINRLAKEGWIKNNTFDSLAEKIEKSQLYDIEDNKENFKREAKGRINKPFTNDFISYLNHIV